MVVGDRRVNAEMCPQATADAPTHNTDLHRRIAPSLEKERPTRVPLARVHASSSTASAHHSVEYLVTAILRPASRRFSNWEADLSGNLWILAIAL